MAVRIFLLFAATSLFPLTTVSAATPSAEEIYNASGVQGGLVVHVGCGDGRLTAELLRPQTRVHGIDQRTENLEPARAHARSLGLYPRVSIDRYDGKHLPYVDNLVNLLVVEDRAELSAEEMQRVLTPGGVMYVNEQGKWTKTVKPRPTNIDDWTHYLHDPSNNAVARDDVVGPPTHLQWVGGPRYSRHHDKMSSLSALVSAGGRLFYIFDEAPPVSILLDPQWNLIARDAFNGTVLWKRPIENWHTTQWSLKNGPAQLPRRLVAVDDRVYVTLDINGPALELDAASGQTLQVYENAAATEEIVVSGDTLFTVNKIGDPAERVRAARRGVDWEKSEWKVMALDRRSGKALWEHIERVVPNTLAVNEQRVAFHNGESIVCLDRADGKQIWVSQPITRAKNLGNFYAPTLVLYRNVILFSGGEASGAGSGGWELPGQDYMSGIDLATGKVLWTAPQMASGYRSPGDVLAVDGLVWSGDTRSGRAVGLFEGRDVRTGEVKRSFEPDVDTYWFHHRCYRGKATEKYLLMSRTGIEFLDLDTESWDTNHFVRGACLYGIMPANGLIYAPQHPCACYLESKLYGFNALASKTTAAPMPELEPEQRLVTGPAYLKINTDEAQAGAEEWPTFRHDFARSGHASTAVKPAPQAAWQTKLTGKLTAPVIADGLLFVAELSTHTLHALDATTGEKKWQFTAGGRIDSPPTWLHGAVLFGSADGWIYCLRSRDGELAWRFLAAKADRRTMSFEQLESLWPVHGSVLVQDNAVNAVSGRSLFLDGGMTLWRLDPASGYVLSETPLTDVEAETGKKHEEFISWLNMPVALPDILSTDNELVYMRSQAFDLTGRRLPLQTPPKSGDADRGAPEAIQAKEHRHIFSPTGFLDDDYWHRSYWMYGTMFVSGWQGYYRAGKEAPSGKILVSDERNIYGFGRKPEYWKWTVPIEHQLFSTEKFPSAAAKPAEPKPQETLNVVRLPQNKRFPLAGKPLTLATWIKPQRTEGVIAAYGGGNIGFVLGLERGPVFFSMRTGKKVSTVKSKVFVSRQWTHVAVVLTKQKQLQVYLNGELSGTASGADFLSKDPIESLELGIDDETPVNPKLPTNGYTGLVEDFRIWSRELSAAEIKQAAQSTPVSDPSDLSLAWSFAAGNGEDSSGNKRHGQIEGAEFVKGRGGKALKFVGGFPKNAGPLDHHVAYHWTLDMPIMTRALMLSDDNLFVAGPEDFVDESTAFRRLTEDDVRQKLEKQMAAWDGKSGGLLWTVSAKTGAKVAEQRLESPPVFNGMAAANGRLYLVGMDGVVRCLK